MHSPFLLVRKQNGKMQAFSFFYFTNLVKCSMIILFNYVLVYEGIFCKGNRGGCWNEAYMDDSFALLFMLCRMR